MGAAALSSFQGGVKALQKKNAETLMPGFVTIGMVLSVIIVITSSIGVSEYKKLSKEDQRVAKGGYIAQVVFLVIALLALLGLIAMTAAMYSK